jgi:hypothetical protein
MGENIPAHVKVISVKKVKDSLELIKKVAFQIENS